MGCIRLGHDHEQPTVYDTIWMGIAFVIGIAARSTSALCMGNKNRTASFKGEKKKERNTYSI